MRSLMQDVAAFHRATDTPVVDNPRVPAINRILLRTALISEEHNELQNAIIESNLIEIADACADLIYVIIGTALEYGIPLDRVWKEVHNTNMAKIDPTTGKVLKREDGKIIKPKEWTPPNIKGILEDFK